MEERNMARRRRRVRPEFKLTIAISRKPLEHRGKRAMEAMPTPSQTRGRWRCRIFNLTLATLSWTYFL